MRAIAEIEFRIIKLSSSISKLLHLPSTVWCNENYQDQLFDIFEDA